MQAIDDYATQHYDGYAVRTWLVKNTDIAMYVAGLYLAFVFKGPDLIAKYVYGGDVPTGRTAKSAWLRVPWVCWNFLLSAFSFYGTYHITPVVLRHSFTDGLRDTLCNLKEEEYYTGPVGMAVGLFALSKGPEFIDTVFILLSGKRNLPFLQWFHHVTTFLFCWHAYAVGSSALNFAAALNYSVHTVMYLYFGLAEAGCKSLVRPFAMYITILQILQMVTGLVLISIIIYEKYLDHLAGRAETDPLACGGTTWDAARVQIFIAMVNFILFSHMFLTAYVFKKPAKKVNGTSATSAKKVA